MELSRQSFRRFVQLYLFLSLLFIPVIVWEVLDPASQAFETEFGDLRRRSFGEPRYGETTLWISGGLVLVHFVSAVALLWFKRWARLLFWLSLPTALVMDMLFGQVVAYNFRWQVWSEAAGSALFGVIVLMSYASGLGATWFEKGAEAQQG